MAGENITDLSGEWIIDDKKKTKAEWLLQSVQEYIAYENGRHGESLITFGGRALQSEALYYYVKDDPTNGAEFIEYSAVVTKLNTEDKRNILMVGIP